MRRGSWSFDLTLPLEGWRRAAARMDERRAIKTLPVKQGGPRNGYMVEDGLQKIAEAR
ncbi:MAG: hypothetical protein WBL40_08120 [Terrimicrobiaceae bacterium]